MTQSMQPDTHASFPLPDAFSTGLTDLFAQAQPAIVQVRTEGRGGGTGVVIQQDGRIITNNHVVPTDDAKVQVQFIDGRTLQAKVLQRNPRLDLALLKVSGGELKALPVGDSGKLRVGELVFAIGHPWGQRWVMTAGVVSSLSTIELPDKSSTQYIKSDVGLAPGNSGGPLLNADGAVVGINAMIFGGDLAVSIPSNVLSTWLDTLPQGRTTLGIEILQVAIPTETQKALASGQKTGLLVVGTPTRNESLKDLFIGDTLLAVSDKPVSDAATLRQLLSQTKAGEAVPMTILRGGQVITTRITTQALEQAAS